MFKIQSSDEMAHALASSLSDSIKALLGVRRDQLRADTDGGYDLGEMAHFIIAAPGDTLRQIEAVANYPILPDPPWEWVLDHGHLFEAPIIVSDDGFGIVLIVPDIEGVDAELIRLLRRDVKIQS